MTEAIFGLVGVLVGSGISWFQSYWTTNKEAEKNARYLAFRVFCILLSEKYGIKKKKYNDWNPVEDFSTELKAVVQRRNHRIEEHKEFVKRVLG
ncbi:hypothetical protein [Chryseobacterium viscerum]|uniref:Uncharacterized protein n=1 Tax=Chryseobacterium viscerum TaxID=1037377 RepID=A0A316WCN2_9FLAO|nr:hypothetical protein [Chryseobacterium viscerum]PWN58083.1 hypothetical protein C1634_024210 [Chryseobacterium viscerum]